MKSLPSSALVLATVALLATGCSDNKGTSSDTTTTPATTATSAEMDTTAAPAAATQAQAGQYYCPMHPEVVTDKAGDCSKCGMALVKKS
jgi:hypothetical protein